MIKVGDTITILDKDRLAQAFRIYAKQFAVYYSEYEKRITEIAGKEFKVEEVSDLRDMFYIRIKDDYGENPFGPSLTSIKKEFTVPEVVLKMDKVLNENS